MSATLKSKSELDFSWKKRPRDTDDDPIVEKRPRQYYFRLESESSRGSEEDTESVYSVQDRETDVVRDTSDTETEVDSNADEYEVEIEYEVASLSESEQHYLGNSSSGSEDIVLAAVAGAIYDSSLVETFSTDGEEEESSDNSSLGEISFGRSDFSICVQCKSENDNPLFRYCEKCFQDRKKFFPPRPRRYRSRSRKVPESLAAPVKLDTLRSCLRGLSQDSGISSSQECPRLDLDQIVVPKHLTPGTSKCFADHEKSTASPEPELRLISDKSQIVSADSGIDSFASNSKQITVSCFSSTGSIIVGGSRKRHLSDSSLSDYECVAKKAKFKGRSSNSEENLAGSDNNEDPMKLVNNENDKYSESLASELSVISSTNIASEVSTNLKSENASSELCIFCNNAPKDSVFLHSSIGHRCCCYTCAKRTLNSIKRCPICNRSVNKVIRIYTA